MESPHNSETCVCVCLIIDCDTWLEESHWINKIWHACDVAFSRNILVLHLK